MPKPKHRTMWMFPRNIRRIEPWKLVQIAKIVDAETGDLTDQRVQDALYAMLDEKQVKSKANQHGVSNSGGFRTYLAQLACLGFFWKDRETKEYGTTYAGEQLINAKEPAKILRCQLLRMQYPSTYGLGHNVQMHPDIKVKPFAFLLRLLNDGRLDGYLTDKDIAIPVIYGHDATCYEACVQKILQLREGETLRSQINSVDDIRTTRRYHEDNEEYDWEKGIEDALTIANTARNYLLAAQLVVVSSRVKGAIESNSDARIAEEIKPWLTEASKIEKLEIDYQEAWQQRYGRFDQTKAVRKLGQRNKTDGLTTCVQTAFLQGHTEAPYGFDVANFIKEESVKWGVSEAKISLMIEPLRPSMPNLEYDTVKAAAVSGGKESTVLEKAMTAILRKLGFDLSEHIGQKKVRVARKGGYPDIRVRTTGQPTCGFADTKATARYGLPIGDTVKLQTYYKDCWNEFPDQSPSEYFLYIAGGFDHSDATIQKNLNDCSTQYGRPVSAVTVDALIRLLYIEDRPSALAIGEAFKKGMFFASAESIINASVED